MKKLFSNKKVVIMGLGLHGGGVSAAKFFLNQGAKVLVTDLKTKKELKESLEKLKGLKIKYVLGKHRKKDFENADLILKNPDVPENSFYLKIAQKNNIPIETDITLFFNYSKAFIVGITGSKGKSTTSVLIYKFLKSKYSQTYLAGNIGLSPLEIISKARDKNAKVVLELSSFALESLKRIKKSPHLAVITTLFPDHLNRYKSFREYIKAKEIIFKYQKRGDKLVLNYDNPILRKFKPCFPSNLYYFSFNKKPPRPGAFVKNEKIFFDNEKKAIISLNEIKLKGKHNLSNILAAVSSAKLFKVPSHSIKSVLRLFKGVENRIEKVALIKGIEFYNDTTATVPEAVISALDFFSQISKKKRLILIAGGMDKNLDYRKLSKEIKKKVHFLILLPGSASQKIEKNIKKWKKFFKVSSMEEAVKKAKDLAQKGDIVLLSPGAASFNLFKNEFHRGELFLKFVNKLKK